MRFTAGRVFHNAFIDIVMLISHVMCQGANIGNDHRLQSIGFSWKTTVKAELIK